MTVTEDAPAAAPEIGHDRRRKEDQRLITGRTSWTDNIQLPGMLHLAMVRSPFAHAKITNIDTSAAKAAPNVVAVLTGADLADEPGRAASTPGRSPPTRSPRPTCRCRRTGSPSPARSSPSSSPAARPRPATPPSSSTSTTRSCPPRSTSRRRRRTRCSRTPTSAPTSRRSGSFDSAEAGTGGDVDEAIAEARADGIVIEREYRQQRLIPAFMEPRSVVVDPTGEQITMWSATQIPHILRFAAGRDDRRPRVQDPGHRPRRRRRLRRQAPGHAGGVDHLRRWPAGSASR